MKKQNIIAAYEEAREKFFTGDLLASEDFETLKKHIGGGESSKGGYSPDYWTIVGFLMGLSVNDQETA